MSQIKTTSTLLAVALGIALFMFQNCAEQPVSSKKAKSSSTSCANLGTCYDGDDNGNNGNNGGGGNFPTTTTTFGGVTTTTSSGGGGTPGQTPQVSNIYFMQNGGAVQANGYYSQYASLQIVVTGSYLTQVQWGSGLTFNCAQTGINASCVSPTVNVGVTMAGFYGSIPVTVRNGTNPVTKNLAVASQCYVLLGECKFLVLGSFDASNFNEVSVRGRSLGAFGAPALNNNSGACNAVLSQDAASNLQASTQFNRTNAQECIFFRAAAPSGNIADYQCYYIGLDNLPSTMLYFNSTHEVPCNGGEVLSKIGLNGSVDTGGAQVSKYAALVAKHRATGLADVAIMRGVCAQGSNSCTISSVKGAHRTAQCGATDCTLGQ